MKRNIIIIGCGKMGFALMQKLVDSDEYHVEGVEKNISRLEEISDQPGVNVFSDISGTSEGDIYIIAVKPRDMEKTAEALSAVLGDAGGRKLVVSIAAGITTDYLKQKLGSRNCSIIRVMPNTPALLGEGVTAIARAADTDPGDLSEVEKIFSCAGSVVMVNESEMDAVTAISGSGPAYFFHIAHLMKDFAEKNGIDRDSAEKLVYQTVKGAGRMMEESPDDFLDLRNDVTSPGGTTEAALGYMSEKGFDDIFAGALEKARIRSLELSKDQG